MENTKHVSDDQYKGRMRLCDERYQRVDKQIDEQEDEMRKVRELTIQMAEMVKRHDDQLRGQDARITNLERQPADQYSKVKTAITTAIISGVIGAILGSILTTPGP